MYGKRTYGQARATAGLPSADAHRTSRSQTRLGKALLGLWLAGFAALLPQAGLWAANSPASCPVNLSVQSISLTDWESGLGPWTVEKFPVKPETFDTPDWAAVGGLPDGRAGTAAFVANLNAGDCGADDESGVLTLTSPPIQIPADSDAPKIAFNHWFDIEYGWDGGNLKISVNGGDFTLVPGSAFETGPYTDVLFEAFDEFGIINNTNPLAEQEAFTGPAMEPGSGSWMASQVNLAGIAAAGDSVQLRFDFGVDACDGAVGWYVDEVEVYSCGEDVPPSTTRLRLANQVINDHGGTATGSAWTLAAAGPTGFSGPGPSVTSGANFQAGSYDLSQTGGPAGYSAGAWVCSGGNQTDDDTIVLADGDDASCTVTNDDIGPTLRLVKTIVNDNGGTVTDPNDFGLRIDGGLVDDRSFYTLSRGTHRASEDGLPGYVAGPWGGDCAPDGSITLALAQVATCTVTNNDVNPGFQLNAGHSGAWFNPQTSGQGVLVDIAAEEQYLFLAWFTYTAADSADPFEHRWLTAQGSYNGNSALLPLYETLGGKFDDPQEVDTQVVGEVLLEFDDCEQGRMSYQFDNEDLQGEFPLVRVIPGSGDVCAESSGNALQAVDINAGMDGAWYDIETSGQGFLIDSHPNPEGGNFIFVAWFTYGEDTVSGQRWLTAQGSFEGPTAVIDVYETTGGSFDDPQPVSPVRIGDMSIDFTDCSHALLTYVIPDEGLQGEIDISRLLPGGAALCEELAGD